jgi:hypothetical protein
MSYRKILALVAGAIVLLLLGFFGGLLIQGGGGPSDTSRQELAKQLFNTKAAMQAGLPFAGLGTEETHLRAAAELADQRLNGSERKAIADAVFAIHQTRSAWQIMINGTCYQSGQMIYLDIGNSECAKQLPNLASSIGVRIESEKTVFIDTTVQAFLRICGVRVQAAIDLLSGRS